MEKVWTAYAEVFNLHFSLYSVYQFRNSLPDSIFFTCLVLSKDRWKFSAVSIDNSQVLLKKTPSKTWKFFLQMNNLQSPLQARFTLVLYPVTFVASFEFLKSATLSLTITYCTTFKSRGASRSRYYLYMEAVLNQVYSTIYSKSI